MKEETDSKCLARVATLFEKSVEDRKASNKDTMLGQKRLVLIQRGHIKPARHQPAPPKGVEAPRGIYIQY
jgi:hypothetical protein